MRARTKILTAIILLEIIIFGGLLIRPKIFQLRGSAKFTYAPNYLITFDFSQPIVKKSFEENFQIKPGIEGEFVWQNFNRQVIFNPLYLEYDVLYTASAHDIKSYVLTKLEEEKVDFKVVSPSSLNLAKVSPNKLPIAKENVFTKSDGKEITLDQPRIVLGKYIDVDISNQSLTIYQNSRIIGVYEISTGRPGMDTPLGDFEVLSKEISHWSVTYGLYMPYSLKFSSGYYIHELPHWPSGFREGTESLGNRVSHGCIRLGIGPAKEVYNFAEIGTPIIIHY